MYFDRHGQSHTPKANDIVRPRKGAFAVIILNNCVLVADGPHAPGVPELPGGGIEGDETPLQAALREAYEETGFDIIDYTILRKLDIHRRFFADDINEYWDYDITYFQLDLSDDSLYFEGKKSSPEDGTVWWLPLNDIRNGAPIKYMERLLLQEWGLI